jgi:NADH-quinone oxidoreductase subunit N
MIAGNVLGMLQQNVKRILGYSSIAHMGYLLVAFLAAGALGGQAAAFYLVTYIITILGAFGVVSVVSGTNREAGTLDDFRGLFWRQPGLGVIFTLMLLSLAGIPLTVGFIGKFYIIAAGASSATWGLIIALVLTSVLGLFYYLRVIVAIYDLVPKTGGKGINPLPRPSWSERYVLGALTVTLLWAGLYPAPILKLVAAALKSLA